MGSSGVEVTVVATEWRVAIKHLFVLIWGKVWDFCNKFVDHIFIFRYFGTGTFALHRKPHFNFLFNQMLCSFVLLLGVIVGTTNGFVLGPTPGK